MRMLLPDINKLAAKYSHSVQFLFVYTMEAHAADEWPIKELEEEIPQHRTAEDRLKAASNFLLKHPLHSSFVLTIDNMENDFVNLYPSWPFRYWVIEEGVIKLKCMPNADQISLDALAHWLSECFQH